MEVFAHNDSEFKYLELLAASGNQCTASRNCNFLHDRAALLSNRLNNHILDEICSYRLPVHEIIHLYNVVFANIELLKTRETNGYFVEDHDKECTCWYIFFNHWVQGKVNSENPLIVQIFEDTKYSKKDNRQVAGSGGMISDEWMNAAEAAQKCVGHDPDKIAKLKPFFEKMGNVKRIDVD